jgi:opine dehydrogenase
MDAATRFTVIGAGHGGKAMAAHLALMGFSTTLYNRTYSHIEAIQKRGGIELECGEGAPCGFGQLSLVTSDMEEALNKAEVIMVVVPSSAHADIARVAAPHFKDGQIVLLHPGRTCGALEFNKALQDMSCAADVTVAEAETFIYASRSEGPALPYQGGGAVGGAARHAHRAGAEGHQLGIPAVHRRGECAAHRVE